MVASDSFAEFLREQLAPLGRVTMRRMFGKTGVFCDGVMLGMVADNVLYLRRIRTEHADGPSGLHVVGEKTGRPGLRHDQLTKFAGACLESLGHPDQSRGPR